MDWYFILFIVAFCVVAIAMIVFAFHGPSCTDTEEYNELMSDPRISKEHNTQQQGMCFEMPLPPTDDGSDTTPVSLTSPYPSEPPPIGFRHLSTMVQNSSYGSTGTRHSQTTRTYPYPTNEEINRMPFPVQPNNSAVSPSVSSPRGNTNSNHQQPRTELRRSEILPSSRISIGSNSSSNTPPPPYSEVSADNQRSSARSRRNRFQKRSSQ